MQQGMIFSVADRRSVHTAQPYHIYLNGVAANKAEKRFPQENVPADTTIHNIYYTKCVRICQY